MSQKEIRLYDDSVIKLTIKQGAEAERFPSTLSGDDLLDFEKINSVSGALVSGELGWTRDTNRLFVGNISEQLNAENKQCTLGGVLAGNKYLGFIDSRSSEKGEAEPIALDTILTEGSYRSFNFGSYSETPDGMWPRLPHYNAKYDAYDGDYLYDVYRNAIILFDHNITSANNPEIINGSLVTKMGDKRKTIFEPRFKGNTSNMIERETVNKHTVDMYGDGFVLFYNVIPDGDTLTFASKEFDENGIDKAETDTNNYSYNIIKINRLPAAKIADALDADDFALSENGGKITLGAKWQNISDNMPATSFDTPAAGQLVVIKSETVGTDTFIKLANSHITVDNLIWLSTAMATPEVAKATIQNLLDGVYATTEYVDSTINAKLSDLNNNIKIELPSLDTPVPDYGRSIIWDPTTDGDITASKLATKIMTEDDELEAITSEVKSSVYYLLAGGIGQITVNHTYKDDETGTLVPSTPLQLGSPGVFSEHLLPIRLAEKDETITISGASEIKVLFSK